VIVATSFKKKVIVEAVRWRLASSIP